MLVYKKGFEQTLKILGGKRVHPETFNIVYRQFCNIVFKYRPMGIKALREKLDRENIRMLIDRIELLEDRLDMVDRKISTRPNYNADVDDNGFPIEKHDTRHK